MLVETNHAPRREMIASPYLDLRAEQFESAAGCSDVAAYIAALMFWPGDESRQTTWRRLASLIAARAVLCEVGTEELEVRAGDIIDFADGTAQLHALLPEITARIDQVEQCGQILIDYLDSRGFAGRGVRVEPLGCHAAPLTLGRAREKHAHVLEVRGKDAHVASEITLKKRWAEFRSVAHLAGAMVNLRMSHPAVDPSAAQFPCENYLLPWFLTRAELIRRETVRAGLAKSETLLALPNDICKLICNPAELDNPLTIANF